MAAAVAARRPPAWPKPQQSRQSLAWQRPLPPVLSAWAAVSGPLVRLSCMHGWSGGDAVELRPPPNLIVLGAPAAPGGRAPCHSSAGPAAAAVAVAGRTTAAAVAGLAATAAAGLAATAVAAAGLAATAVAAAAGLAAATAAGFGGIGSIFGGIRGESAGRATAAAVAAGLAAAAGSGPWLSAWRRSRVRTATERIVFVVGGSAG